MSMNDDCLLLTKLGDLEWAKMINIMKAEPFESVGDSVAPPSLMSCMRRTSGAVRSKISKLAGTSYHEQVKASAAEAVESIRTVIESSVMTEIRLAFLPILTIRHGGQLYYKVYNLEMVLFNYKIALYDRDLGLLEIEWREPPRKNGNPRKVPDGVTWVRAVDGVASAVASHICLHMGVTNEPDTIVVKGGDAVDTVETMKTIRTLEDSAILKVDFAMAMDVPTPHGGVSTVEVMNDRRELVIALLNATKAYINTTKPKYQNMLDDYAEDEAIYGIASACKDVIHGESMCFRVVSSATNGGCGDKKHKRVFVDKRLVGGRMRNVYREGRKLVVKSRGEWRALKYICR